MGTPSHVFGHVHPILPTHAFCLLSLTTSVIFSVCVYKGSKIELFFSRDACIYLCVCVWFLFFFTWFEDCLHSRHPSTQKGYTSIPIWLIITPPPTCHHRQYCFLVSHFRTHATAAF